MDMIKCRGRQYAQIGVGRCTLVALKILEEGKRQGMYVPSRHWQSKEKHFPRCLRNNPPTYP